MKNTKTVMGAEARKYVHAGVNAIYQPVKVTLGPQAKTALLYRTYNRGSRITDDGVTVAEVQEPKNPFIRLVADTFKEMCKRTVEKVGDGTTTTAVIGGYLYNICYNTLFSGGTSNFTAKQNTIGPADLRRDILASATKVKAEILKRSTKVDSLEDLEKVASISVKDAELGKLVAGMAYKIGVDGYIDVVEGFTGEIQCEVIEGFRFPAKVPAKAFVNNPKRYEMVAEDCPVILTNYAIDGGEIAAPLRDINTAGITKLIIIAPSFSENALVNMVNACKQGFFIFPVAVPGLRTEQFEDLEIYTGATFINKNKDKKLQAVNKDDLGFLGKLIVKDTEAREEATATGGKGTHDMMSSKVEDGERKTFLTTAVKERIEVLKSQVTQQTTDSFKKLMQRRIASMSSAVGVIRVGDSTQASSLYRKLKIEDCVYACKAALRGGYSKGGGIELKEIAEEILDEKDILRPALIHPYDLIQASVSGGLKIGPEVIDPTEALYWAVEHATSVVAQLVTVEVLTPEIDETGPGDGYMAIAKMIGEISITVKRHLGQLQESQEEQERDRLQGLTTDEKVMLDQG